VWGRGRRALDLEDGPGKYKQTEHLRAGASGISIAYVDGADASVSFSTEPADQSRQSGAEQAAAPSSDATANKHTATITIEDATHLGDFLIGRSITGEVNANFRGTLQYVAGQTYQIPLAYCMI
jgi:hypothetical protein